MNAPVALTRPDALERGKEYRVPLHWVEVDKAINARAKLTPGHIRALREAYGAGEIKPPPLTVALVDGSLILIDGFHRYEALNEAETRADELGNLASLVMVKVHPTARTVEEARWQASCLNWQTTLPLTKADREEGVRRYFAASQHRLGDKRRGNAKSIRQVAGELSVPPSSFQRLLKRLDDGKYLRMLMDDVGEPSRSSGPGDHWRHKRARKAKRYAAALAQYGLKEPEPALELLAQAYRRVVEASGGEHPASLAELVQERGETLDPYTFN